MNNEQEVVQDEASKYQVIKQTWKSHSQAKDTPQHRAQFSLIQIVTKSNKFISNNWSTINSNLHINTMSIKIQEFLNKSIILGSVQQKNGTMQVRLEICSFLYPACIKLKFSRKKLSMLGYKNQELSKFIQLILKSFMISYSKVQSKTKLSLQLILVRAL